MSNNKTKFPDAGTHIDFNISNMTVSCFNTSNELQSEGGSSDELLHIELSNVEIGIVESEKNSMIKVTITPGTTHVTNLREETIRNVHANTVLHLKMHHEKKIFNERVLPYFRSKCPMRRLNVSCERLSSASQKRTHEESDGSGSMLVETEMPPPKRKKIRAAVKLREPYNTRPRKTKKKSKSKLNKTQQSSEPLVTTVKCEASQEFNMGDYGNARVIQTVTVNRTVTELTDTQHDLNIDTQFSMDYDDGDETHRDAVGAAIEFLDRTIENSDEVAPLPSRRRPSMIVDTITVNNRIVMGRRNESNELINKYHARVEGKMESFRREAVELRSSGYSEGTKAKLRNAVEKCRSTNQDYKQIVKKRVEMLHQLQENKKLLNHLHDRSLENVENLKKIWAKAHQEKRVMLEIDQNKIDDTLNRVQAADFECKQAVWNEYIDKLQEDIENHREL